jgi:hypothetical protein
MIVKYLDGDVWAYIDNVRQVSNECIDHVALIRQYEEEVQELKRDDVASYINFDNDGPINPELNVPAAQRLPEDIIKVNKVFLMTTERLSGEIRDGGYHAENLLDAKLLLDELPVNVVILYLSDHGEFKTVVLITNQKTYLMNDKGQTIERLV